MAGAFNKLMALTFATLLAKPFTSWDAYKNGLIDEKGNKIRKPENQPERDSLKGIKDLVRKVKRLLIKVVPDSRLLGILIAAFLLKKESISEEEESIQKIITENMTKDEMDVIIQQLEILVKNKFYL